MKTLTENKNNLQYIYKHFGSKNQIAKLEEELKELLVELNKPKEEWNYNLVCDEIADVLILCLQWYLNSGDRIAFCFNKKIVRTLERIKSGYYANKLDKK